MSGSIVTAALPVKRAGAQDVSFAIGIVFILAVLFLPLPAALIDVGLAISIALAVLILMGRCGSSDHSTSRHSQPSC